MHFEKLERIARNQRDLVTNQQLRECGYTRRAIDGLVVKSVLRRVHRGVYALFGSPDSWEQRAHAAILAVPSAAISHRAALRLWGLVRVDTQIEIVRLDSRARLADVIGHKTLYLPASHLSIHGGLPVTSSARTLVDVAKRHGDARLREFVHRGLDARILSVDGVRACLDEMTHVRPTGAERLRRVLNEIDDEGDSALERSALRLLLKTGLPAPACQYVVVTEDRRMMIDFAYPELKLGIEIDGYAFHSERQAFHDDRARNNALAREGWTLLHLTSGHLEAGVSAALETYGRLESAHRVQNSPV